jgi:hypothetical protein
VIVVRKRAVFVRQRKDVSVEEKDRGKGRKDIPKG